VVFISIWRDFLCGYAVWQFATSASIYTERPKSSSYFSLYLPYGIFFVCATGVVVFSLFLVQCMIPTDRPLVAQEYPNHVEILRMVFPMLCGTCNRVEERRHLRLLVSGSLSGVALIFGGRNEKGGKGVFAGELVLV